MNQVESEIFQSVKDSIILPNTQSLVDWCKQIYLTNPPYNISGYFDVHKSRYLVEPLKALESDLVNEVVVCGNPRGGKTLLAEAYLLSVLKLFPSDIWWGVHKNDSIKSMMDVRLLPLLQANGVRFTDDRFQKTQRFIKFPIGSLKLVGAHNARAMTQTAGRVLIGDEVHEWTDGVLDQFKTRADDFPHSKKILLISMACDDGKDFHKEWMKGTQEDYGFKCPHCEFEQKYLFHFKFDDGKYGGLNWDRNDYTCPKGLWDIDKAAPTSHYTCTNPACRHNFYQTAAEKRQLNDCGLYIPSNPNSGSIRSFRWNALATPDVATHEQLCREYLLADFEANRGRYKAKRNYWLTRMSDFFSVGKSQVTQQGIIGDLEAPVSGSTLVPVMGVDNNSIATGLPYVICTFVPEQKQIHITKYGIADTYDDVERIQLENRVKHQRVLCDTRWQTGDNVYMEIYKHRRKDAAIVNGRKMFYSWISTKGIGLKNGKEKIWCHGKDKRTGIDIWKPYSPFESKPIKFGTSQYIKDFQVTSIKFHGDTIKDTLKGLLENTNPEWKLVMPEAAKNDVEFMAQLNSEKKIIATDANGYPYSKWQKGSGDNDYFDALCLCILAGMRIGYL